MMFVHGERVCLDELRSQTDAAGRSDVATMRMDEPEGIDGWNPLKYASAELGQEIVEFCAERIGRKAIDVLEGRIEPPEKVDGEFLDTPTSTP